MIWKCVFVFVMYLAIFISGFVITILLGTTKSSFDGLCPLYMDIKWKDSVTLEVESFGRKSTCNYLIYLPLLSCILFPLVMLIAIGYTIFQILMKYTNAEKTLQMLQIPLFYINCLNLVLLFVAACILSVGRSVMCSNLTSNEKANPTCQSAEDIKWKNPDFKTSSFVRDIVLSEIVLWICLIWWILIIVAEIVAIKRERNLRILLGIKT